MPRLHDNLTVVTLDLHGATVPHAISLIKRTVALSSARGRSQIRVIHGQSTSGPDGHSTTIKHALQMLLREGSLPDAIGALPLGGETVIGLPLGQARDQRALTLVDVWE